MSPRVPEWVKEETKLYQPYTKKGTLVEGAPEEIVRAYQKVQRWWDDFFEKCDERVAYRSRN